MNITFIKACNSVKCQLRKLVYLIKLYLRREVFLLIC